MTELQARARTVTPMHPPYAAHAAILELAARISPLPGSALAWYRHDPIDELDHLTAAELVQAGRADDVLVFLLRIARAECVALDGLMLLSA